MQTILPFGKAWKLLHKGLTNKTMYSTFNCGIGFVRSVPKEEVSKVLANLRTADVIGEVTKGTGIVCITSAFNQRTVRL